MEEREKEAQARTAPIMQTGRQPNLLTRAANQRAGELVVPAQQTAHPGHGAPRAVELGHEWLEQHPEYVGDSCNRRHEGEEE